MLRSRNIALTPLGAADITDEYVEWLNDPETFRYLGTKFGQTRASVTRYVEHFEPPNVLCRILTLPGGEHVGNIALHLHDPIHRHMEIGIVIGNAAARGKGIGRTACSLLTAFAFEHLGLHKVTAGTVQGNEGMKKVFHELGFKTEGTLREHYYLDGAFHDVLRFGVLRDEFRVAHDEPDR